MAAKIKVLCVDDNADAADSTADLLTLHEFETRVCHDGPSAVAAAQEFQPDVCLLDLSMPGMNGLEVARQIRETTARPPRMVALTALWDVATTHLTHNARFHAHLVKPVTVEKLLEAVSDPPAATS